MAKCKYCLKRLEEAEEAVQFDSCNLCQECYQEIETAKVDLKRLQASN
jgi:hypothetical protein